MRHFQLLTFSTMFFEQFHVKLTIHFSLEKKTVKNYLFLLKLAAQMVTLTPSENLSLLLYQFRNKNFNFGTTKTLNLHTWSMFSTVTQQKIE
jgi:hypothetical protein